MTRLDDLGKLILRLGIASLLLFHGVFKLQSGIGFVEQMVNQAGLPQQLAYGVYFGEIVAPLLVIVGLLTRPAALIMAFDVAMAIFLARRDDLTRIGSGGGWAVEIEGALFVGALAIAFLGGGRLAVGGASPYN